jgi:hypothetical protein
LAVGETGADGLFTTTLDPGTYAVSYRLAGYVPIADSETEIHTDGQVVTTALSMLLEAEGATAARRVRIILNWGSQSSQVRDADSHITCPCRDPAAHVDFSDKNHSADGHTVDLDVDDTDWGGPETITLNDPPPGTYTYWIHDYSGPPAALGQSDVVVRVLLDDAVAGEFRVPPDVTDRVWHPFKAVVVEPDLTPRITHFSQEELTARADRVAPAGYEVAGNEPLNLGESGCFLAVALFVVVGIGVVVLLFFRRHM